MSESKNLEEGDLVQLKSGGPAMSVQAMEGTRITCMWFDQEGTLQERTFPLGTSKKMEGGGELPSLGAERRQRRRR